MLINSSLPFLPQCLCRQVRTQTLVKNAIIQIDAAPFRQWYQQHYGTELGQKKGEEKAADAEEKKVRLHNSRCLSVLYCGCN